MAKTNMARVILGGIVAGIVLFWAVAWTVRET